MESACQETVSYVGFSVLFFAKELETTEVQMSPVDIHSSSLPRWKSLWQAEKATLVWWVQQQSLAVELPETKRYFL